MIADLELAAFILLVALLFLVVGFVMGRTAAKPPVSKKKKLYPGYLFDPGTVEEEADQFTEMMYGEEEEETPKRIRTIDES